MVKALDMIVCGGAWVLHGTRACRRDKAEVSPWHFYWGCPALKETPDEGVFERIGNGV